MPLQKTDLTPKQQRFVEAYVGPARGNVCEAARIAGYRGSSQTLRAVGYENLTKPRVATAVKERTEMALSKMSAEDVLNKLSRIASGHEPNANVSDRLRPLQRWGKYHALWTEVASIPFLTASATMTPSSFRQRDESREVYAASRLLDWTETAPMRMARAWRVAARHAG